MSQSALMRVNGLFATINTPESLKGEETYGLPPYDECPAFNVDEYPACPANWMHGSDKATSYFIPTKPGRGMWFDFTLNESHSHHVAVVISVQGVNPITGQRVSALNLEKYQNQCPIHKIPFKGLRFCPECGYNWPAQNYLATTTRQILWLDGFRSEDGKVRQYIITEEEIRSVAAQIIGDDRVYAIGFAFYLSKKPRDILTAKRVPFGGNKKGICESTIGAVKSWFSPAGTSRGYPPSHSISPSVKISPQDLSYVQGAGISQPDSLIPNQIQIDPNSIPSQIQCSMPSVSGHCISLGDTNDFVDLQSNEDYWLPTRPQGGYPPDDASSLMQLASGDGNLDIYYSTQTDEDGNEYFLESSPILDPESFCPPAKKVYKNKFQKKLEVGAGAQIWQEVGTDPESVDFWQSEPAGLIYVNYVPVEQAKEIIAAGKVATKKDGFLNGILVGN